MRVEKCPRLLFETKYWRTFTIKILIIRKLYDPRKKIYLQFKNVLTWYTFCTIKSVKSEKFPPIAQNNILSNCQRVPVFNLTEVSTSPCADVFFIVLFPQWESYVSVEKKNWDTVKVLRITSRNAIFSWRPTVHLYVLNSHVFNFINGLNYRVEIWYINKANILGVQRISKIRTIKFENKTIGSFFGILIFAIFKFRNVCRSMYISSL